MKNISEWIDVIIQDLVEPDKKLKDILLKVQVLSFKLQNDKLKTWVENELNGYIGKECPDYRRIPTAVFGNLIQDRGFGSFLTRNNNALPLDFMKKDAREQLQSVHMRSSVAELEKMISADDSYQVNLPHFIQAEVSKHLANGWQVDTAWQKISTNSLDGILSSIRSNMVTFLLELNQEIGNSDDFSIMKNKKEVDKAFEKTIGTISGNTVNVSIGDNSLQANNQGENAKQNVSKGDNNQQVIGEELLQEFEKFSKGLADKIDDLGLGKNDKEDIENEILRINAQLRRDQPKKGMLEGALNVINGILTGVTANAYTPIILDQINSLTMKM